MARYQITYTKHNSLTTWTDDVAEAVAMARRLRYCGYTVSIWMHDTSGSRELTF